MTVIDAAAETVTKTPTDDRGTHSTGPTGEGEQRIGPWCRFRTSWLGKPTVALAVLWLALVLVAAVAPFLLTAGDPLAGDIAQKLLPPSGDHWFGTDQLGRDIYTRTVYGAGLTVQAVLVALALGLTVGSVLGLVSGFAGGVVDAVLMRIADILLAIPTLLLSLAVIVALGFGTLNVAVAVGITSVASISRVMRAEVLKVKQSPYIEAARAGGARTGRILFRHVLPNSLGPVIVLGVLEFGSAILAISALSFLGYGATPPAPEWGALVAQGRDFLAGQGWIATLPGLVVAASVLSANRIANVLDDRSDR